MSSAPRTLLDCSLEDDHDFFEMEDYAGALARWCPGCGDHSVLTAVQRVLADEQLVPEQTVFVSGIGCSSRFPHYMNTYGFHGLHGRALPIATGVKLQRPDLNVFVVMGDGDCTSIGAGHWLHGLRYNLKMVVLLLDNGIYGLTKKQMSPTTPMGVASNTALHGPYLPPLNPLSVALGVTNVSYVAQTVEWIPDHLYETVRAAYHHDGLSFVRIVQRCPAYLPGMFDGAIKDVRQIEMLVHPRGVMAEELASVYKNRVEHDPTDLAAARAMAEDFDKFRVGVFYRSDTAARYDEIRHLPVHTAEEKLTLLARELDRYAV